LTPPSRQPPPPRLQPQPRPQSAIEQAGRVAGRQGTSEIKSSIARRPRLAVPIGRQLRAGVGGGARSERLHRKAVSRLLRGQLRAPITGCPQSSVSSSSRRHRCPGGWNMHDGAASASGHSGERGQMPNAAKKKKTTTRSPGVGSSASSRCDRLKSGEGGKPVGSRAPAEVEEPATRTKLPPGQRRRPQQLKPSHWTRCMCRSRRDGRWPSLKLLAKCP